MQTPPPFADLPSAAPDPAALDAAYVGVRALAADAATPVLAALAAWEDASRPARQWASWSQLRFRQDTRDAERRADRKRSDALENHLKELDDAVLAALLARPDQDTLEAAVGPGLIACWRADRAAFDPSLTDALQAEQDLCAEYAEVTAEAVVPFRGQDYSLVTIGKHAVSSDRDTRHASERARWSWFAANRATLDRIYDDLVRLRAGMAATLGLPDFVSLGYLRMQRVDYDRSDVAAFRDQVRTRLVPLVSRLMAERGVALGVDGVKLWDESIPGPAGSPPLLCGMDGLGGAGVEAFDRLDPAIGAFYRGLRDGGYIDLGTRPGKSGGGFCTWMHAVRSPFVFCSGNGTAADAKTLVHEVGHAFQGWSSRDAPVSEGVFPTFESAEIHSMGLEHLAWPVLDAFFGDGADAYRREHLIGGLRFIPYGVAVDHFQHLVYENPSATPDARHAMWRDLERVYMPWRDNGDLPHVDLGGFWQRQRHIFARPFYYIDYTLAQTCALQLWASSLTDHAGTMERYHALCQRGGTLPFQALCRSGGLTSPFADGCLDGVVTAAEAWLDAH